jgi:autotransporter passenger strand-loop-strand repeat protein
MKLWWELSWHLQRARATIKGGTNLAAHISGGLQAVSGVGGATIFAGPEVVQSAGTAIGTTVSGSGTEIVSSGGTTTGTARRGKTRQRGPGHGEV